MSELLDMFNARKLGKCPVCKCNEPEKGGFRDDKSLREFGISGLCQKCQDEARVYLRRPLKSNTKTMKYLMGRMMKMDYDDMRQYEENAFYPAYMDAGIDDIPVVIRYGVGGRFHIGGISCYNQYTKKPYTEDSFIWIGDKLDIDWTTRGGCGNGL